MNADNKIPTELADIQRDPDGISATLRVDELVTVQMLASVGPRRAFSVYHVPAAEAAALNARRHARLLHNAPVPNTTPDPQLLAHLMETVEAKLASTVKEVESAGKAKSPARPRSNTRVRDGGSDPAGGPGVTPDGEPGNSSDAG